MCVCCVCARPPARVCTCTCSTDAEVGVSPSTTCIVGIQLRSTGLNCKCPYSLTCAVGFDNFSFLKDPMTKKVQKPWSAAAQDSSIIELTGNVSETLELQGFMGLRPQKPNLGIWLAFMATGGSVHPVQPPLLRVQTGDHLLRVLLVQQKKSSVKRRKMKRSKEIPQ